MQYTFTPHGVCARQITLDIDENNETINEVSFFGGCNGNLKGISSLVKGKTIDEVIEALAGIDCNFKGTSCPDQLAKALTQIKKEL